MTTSASAATNSGAAGLPITKEEVQRLCVQQGFYRTPDCNERLYLHHKGFDQIAGLDEFTETRVAWLEGNSFTRIEGLEKLTKLRQLFLHQNLLRTIEGLDTLTDLDTLNLSDNFLTHLSGLDAQADSLTMLQLKNNRLSSIDGLAHLLVLRKLSCLDLSGNRIEDGDTLLDLLARLPSLKSLHLTGNPCVRTIKNYRKTVLSKLPNLMHLDEKPIFKDERRMVDAWARGGVDAEREEKKKMREEEVAAVHKRLEEFREMKARAREAQGLNANSGSSSDEHDSDSTGDGSGSEDDDTNVWVPGQQQPTESCSSMQPSATASNPRSSATASNADPAEAPQSVE